jgi:hypothetical protein
VLLLIGVCWCGDAAAQNPCGSVEGRYIQTQGRVRSSYNALLALINQLNVLNTQAAYRVRLYDQRVAQMEAAAKQAEEFSQSVDCSTVPAEDFDSCVFVLRSAGNRLRAAYLNYQRAQLDRERYVISSQNSIRRQQARVATEQQRYDQLVNDKDSAKAALDECTSSDSSDNSTTASRSPSPTPTPDNSAGSGDDGTSIVSTQPITMSSQTSTSLSFSRMQLPRPSGMSN